MRDEVLEQTLKRCDEVLLESSLQIKKLQAHNRHLVEALGELLNFCLTEESPDGFDDPHKGFVVCDAGWQDGVEWGWNQIRCKLQAILEVTPPAKLALAEAAVLRAAEDLCKQADAFGEEGYWIEPCHLDALYEAVEAMQEAKNGILH